VPHRPTLHRTKAAPLNPTITVLPESNSVNTAFENWKYERRFSSGETVHTDGHACALEFEDFR
jgi:hypothetical protein